MLILRHVIFSYLIIIWHAESTENLVNNVYKKLLEEVINVNKKRPTDTIVEQEIPTKYNFAKLIGQSRDEVDTERDISHGVTTQEPLIYIILEQNPNNIFPMKKKGKELVINHDHNPSDSSSSDDSDEDSDITIHSEKKFLRKRHNWMKKCQKHAEKQCKKACKDSYKNLCTAFDCKSKMKKMFKKECKRSCKNEFQDSSKGDRSKSSENDSGSRSSYDVSDDSLSYY
ncbi:hypothetical protein O0L34_g14851 [Tuta absoluta]|nr:hypothetical protein O0L34_g14851 [Tuta absoluta]